MLDFQKAFDSVPHQRLLCKLKQCGINGQMLEWISLWLTTENNVSLLMVLNPNGFVQGTVLGPLLFLIFINDIAVGTSSTLRLFADDCLLYQVTDSSRDAELLQHDLHLITEWCKLWQMRLNLDKCVTLHCYRTINPHLTNYLVENHTLKNVNQHLYLGVMLLHI